MFESTQILEFFPTLVWQHQLARETFEPLNDGLMERIAPFRTTPAPLGHGEHFQTPTDLQRRDGFEPFIEVVRDAVTGVLEFLDVEHQGFAVTGCWANIAGPDAVHKAHTHPNNYLSGVYYVRAPEGCGDIVFTDPRPQTSVFWPKLKRTTRANAGKFDVDVAEGLLMVFPAWQPHRVDPNHANTERVSVSFNIMFDDFAETISRPLWGREEA